MQRKANVLLVFLSASVILATSLITEKQVHSATAGRSGVSRLLQRARLAEASLSNLKTLVARLKGHAKYSSRISAATNHTALRRRAQIGSVSTLRKSTLAQKLNRKSGDAPGAADDDADLPLVDILQKMQASKSPRQTHVAELYEHHAALVQPQASAALLPPMAAVAVKETVSGSSRSKDSSPLLPVVAVPVKSASQGSFPKDTAPLLPVARVAAVAVKSVYGRTGGKDSIFRDMLGRLSWGKKLDAWKLEYARRKEAISRYAPKVFFSVLLWAVLTALIGIFYHHEKLHPPKLDPEGVNVSLHDRERLDRQRWRFGLMECSELPSLCLLSFFCAPIRWADTMRMAGFMNYFSALALVIILTVLGSLSLGIGFIALLAVFVHYRQRMRQKFEVRSQSCGSTYLSDVMAFVFCPSCSIVQEARQIEEAYLARHSSVREEYAGRQTMRLTAVKV